MELSRKTVAWLIGLAALAWFAGAGLCAYKLFGAPRAEAEGVSFDYQGCQLLGGLLGVIGGLVCFIAAIQLGARSFEKDAEPRAIAVTILVAGVVSGILLAMIALRFLAEDIGLLSKWVNAGERAGAWKIVAAVLGIILGAGLALFSAVPAKAQERKDETLRRLVHGTNAFVGAFFVLLGLIAVNVLAAAKLPNKLDTTSSGIYTLDENTKKYLTDLPKKVNVTIIFPDKTNRILEDTRWLLEACKDANRDRFEVETMKYDERSVEQFKKDYPQVNLAAGLLVSTDNKTRYSLIPAVELGLDDGTFRGERRLMQELRFLADDSQKPVIYFTQGHGELDLAGKIPRRSATRLAKFLKSANFEVKPLPLELAGAKVPDDAKLIVVADPALPLRPEAVQALGMFLKKPDGKLIVLSSPHVAAPGGSAIPSGLEPLLAEYGIDLVQSYLMGDPGRGQLLQPPEVAFVEAAEPVRERGQPTMQNPLANLFARPVPFPDCRGVSFAPSANPGWKLLPLAVTVPDRLNWFDQIRDDALRTFDQMMESTPAGEVLRKAKKLGPGGRVVGMGAIEANSRKAKLAVLGCGQFFADDMHPGFKMKTDLPGQTLTVLLDWVRDRPAVGTLPRPYETYKPKTKLDSARLYFFPLGLAILAIGGLGGAVWIIRRR